MIIGTVRMLIASILSVTMNLDLSTYHMRFSVLFMHFLFAFASWISVYLH